MTMSIHSFLSYLPHFKSLCLLDFDCLFLWFGLVIIIVFNPHEEEQQELFQVLSDLQLPLFILINRILV